MGEQVAEHLVDDRLQRLRRDLVQDELGVHLLVDLAHDRTVDSARTRQSVSSRLITPLR